MRRFVQGEDRTQATLLPELLDDYVTENNPVRVIDVFVDNLDLGELGFEGVEPAVTGRPSYHPSMLLKIYIYGYLNRIQSTRRLEVETQRNVELMWLVSRLMPDFKTIANFRKDNSKAIRSVCRQFVELCRRLDLFSQSIIAIDGSKFKAVNNRDKNFTSAKIERRMQQVDESINRYLAALDTADREEPSVATIKTDRLKEKIAVLKEQMQRLKEIEVQLNAAPDKQISLTDPDARSMATSGRGSGMVGYNVQTAVDTKHHLIVAHEVTNVGHDRGQLSKMAKQASDATGIEELTVGKTYLACALAHKACREGYSSYYVKLTRLFQELDIGRADGRYAKIMRQCAKADVLIMDEWGLAVLTDQHRRDLLEILDDRYNMRATIITSQLPIAHWHEAIGDPTLADAILDRVVHNAYKINLSGKTMRKDLEKLTTERTKA